MNSSAYQISYRRSESARPDSDNTDSTNKPCALRVPLDVRPSELTEPCLFYFHGGTENQPKSTEKNKCTSLQNLSAHPAETEPCAVVDQVVSLLLSYLLSCTRCSFLNYYRKCSLTSFSIHGHVYF